MESSTILTADVLDIIFEGRNKEYGAYDLRRTYDRRLKLSITVMLSVICMLSLGFVFAGKKKKLDTALLAMKDIELASVEPQQKPVEPPLPPPMKPPAPPPQVQMIRNTTVAIVPDKDVREDEKPPETEQMENAQIGKFNREGEQENGIVNPPIDVPGTGVIEEPKKDDKEEDGIFVSVQIESEYPGGKSAWLRFLNRNFNYPQEAQDQNVEGTVLVQFIVDKEGNVSDVEVVSGPAELRAEAIRVIKKSGKWTPAVQNGNKVRSYKKQPIIFKLSQE